MSKQKQGNYNSSRVDALEEGQRQIIDRLDRLAEIILRVVPPGASCASSSNGEKTYVYINVYALCSH